MLYFNCTAEKGGRGVWLWGGEALAKKYGFTLALKNK
jgi:hypothetical protein